MHRIIVIIVIAAAVLAGVWSFSSYMSGSATYSGECKNIELGRIASPTKAYEAIAYRRDCGSTGLSSHVAVLPVGTKLSDVPGNAFRVTQGPGVPHQPWIHLQWATEKGMVISFDRAAQVFQRETDLNGVTVHFEPAMFPPDVPGGLLVNSQG
jgi:hypothetical protein